MARHDVIKYRMAVIKAMREGEAWCEGPNFYNGDRALKKAADYFGLLLSDRGDREHLLRVLAEVLFGRDAGGRRRKCDWTEGRLVRLGRAAERVRQENPKLMSDRKLSELFWAEHKKDPKKDFQSAEAIRVQLPAARRALAEVEN
jgi:hypothetical protein